mmetsp:Transcript_12074/g.48577  ORF Transcript_12074/g.48577 Transcript_12074/m.48577 type:complete len:219 (+) Transcript_12074:858-1514(+)
MAIRAGSARSTVRASSSSSPSPTPRTATSSCSSSRTHAASARSRSWCACSTRPTNSPCSTASPPALTWPRRRRRSTRPSPSSPRAAQASSIPSLARSPDKPVVWTSRTSNRYLTLTLTRPRYLEDTAAAGASAPASVSSAFRVHYAAHSQVGRVPRPHPDAAAGQRQVRRRRLRLRRVSPAAAPRQRLRHARAQVLRQRHDHQGRLNHHAGVLAEALD